MPEQRKSSTGASEPITLVGVGDISPNREDPPSIFRFCGDVFRKADIVFGQMEAPLSDRGAPQFVPSRPAKLCANNIPALTEEGAGFDVMSHAAKHADSNKTMIVKAYIQDKRIQKVTYIPVLINSNREPEVLQKQDPRAQEIFDYVKEISEAENLSVRFSWEGDEVLISS